MTANFAYTPMFNHQELKPEAYRLLTKDYVQIDTFRGQEFLRIKGAGLSLLAEHALHDLSFFLRESHNAQVAKILSDPEASANDKFVARLLLQNAVVAAEGVLPFCQDTGTATIVAKKGQYVLTELAGEGESDEACLAAGVFGAYSKYNLRYSQNAPLSMYEEVNTENNLPAQIDIYATSGNEYEFLFLAKGGGSANKTYLFQETKAVLNKTSLPQFLSEKMRLLGTSACPPYHLVFVVGGLSAEMTLKTVKLASAGELDALPFSGNSAGRAFRDRELEEILLKVAENCGMGAQFGGKYFAHDVRVIRLPRHGASCPIGMGVSCSAHRNLKAKITKEGLWLEKMDEHPERWLSSSGAVEEVVKINLNQPMSKIVAELSKYPLATRFALSGTLIVARDIAHAKLKEHFERTGELPAYIKEHPIYYAGPAKTPAGLPSGSFGPTTAGRMDGYVDWLQSQGASLVMIAKGNRSSVVREACHKHGGFYLGSIGGPAAILAADNIKKVTVKDYPELGMEAIYAIEVVDFPAFMLIDDKGNDFFQKLC